jgi:ribonuclease-3 family protein
MELLPGSWKKNDVDVQTIPLKSVAHLGDAVYELYVRRKTIFLAYKINDLHKLTTSLVNATFHAELLETIKAHLTEEELNLVKRARNLSLTASKRRDHVTHRISTSFEALIGYLYLTDEKRLEEIFHLIDMYIEEQFIAD